MGEQASSTLTDLLAEVIAIDRDLATCEGPERVSNAQTRWLGRRLSYVLMEEVIFPESARSLDDLAATVIPAATRTNPHGESLLDCLALVRSVLSDELVRAEQRWWPGLLMLMSGRVKSPTREKIGSNPEWRCPWLFRGSEMALTKWWIRQDGPDHLSFLFPVEKALGRYVRGLEFVTEYPVVDLGQFAFLSGSDYSAEKHLARLLAAMGWTADKAASDPTVREALVCEMMAVLWGVPFAECHAGAQIDDLCRCCMTSSRWWPPRMRIEWFAAVFALVAKTAKTKRELLKMKKKLLGCLQRAVKQGQTIRQWLREPL